MAKKDFTDALNGETENSVTPEVVTISREEFEQLKSGKTELKQLVEGLAQAIQESRKPYVSPGQEENERMFKESQKKLAEGQRRRLELDRQACPHIMACNPLSDSFDMHNRSSFLRHRLDTGAVILMCTNCQKVVWPDDPEYGKFASMRTGNRPSSAGERFFSDPLAVQRAGR